MSVLTILAEHSEIRNSVPNCKDRLKHLDGQVWSLEDWHTPIFVPDLGLRYAEWQAGTAIDYVICAMLAHKVGLLGTDRSSTIAEKALHRFPKILRYAEKRVILEKNPIIRLRRQEGIRLALQQKQEIIKFLKIELASALVEMENYILIGENLEKLVYKALFLSEMDVAFRILSLQVVDRFFKYQRGETYFSQFSTVPEEAIAKNVLQMAKLFETTVSQFPIRRVQLNVTFGKMSELLRGGDADFIFDKTLIDIKATKKLGYDTSYMAQIFAYAAMANAIGRTVDKVGIYFARYGLFAILPLSDINNSDIFLEEFLAKMLAAEASKTAGSQNLPVAQATYLASSNRKLSWLDYVKRFYNKLIRHLT